jgi:hypothetical protein
MILEINMAQHYKFMCLYTATWKPLTSSLWMNIIDFIFWLLHIRNCLTLSVLSTLIPLHSPCTTSIGYAHLSPNCENTYGDCIDFSDDYAHNSDDCVNTLNDQMNTTTNLVDTLDISSIDFCIPNSTLLQLLLFWKLKINTMFTVRSMIYSLSSSFFICGFCS